jgi:iron complex transport system ATP-binding protein
MEVAEVTHLAPRLFPTLSGGEKGRASFARVLAQGTRVLLLDEPTAALDIRHQEAVLVQARDQAAAGDAVVVVLHDLTLAAAYSDVVAVLDAGRLRGYGAPREVLTSELLTEVYRYPIDVLEHPVRGELVVLPVRERAVTSAAGPATPDHLHDRPTDL